MSKLRPRVTSDETEVKKMKAREEGMIMNTNEILMEIKQLKKETKKSSWLLGEELTDQIIRVLEEREEEVLEHIMWSAT